MSALGAVAAALALGACGGGGTKTVTVAAPPKKPAPKHTGTSGPVGPAPTAKPIASSDTSWDGLPFRLDILSLTRSGGLASLTVRLSNTQARDNGLNTGTNVRDLFGKRRFDDSMDGVVLIDTAHGRKYPVARDVHHNCICDRALNGTSVANASSVELSASFAAPPADVGTVNVLVPHFGTFRDVPIH